MSGPASSAGIPSPAPRYQPLVVVVVAVCAGIVADRCHPLPIALWWLIAGAGLGLWLLAWRRGRLRLCMLALLLGAGATAAARHHAHWSLFARDDLGHFVRPDNQPVCLEAVARRGARVLPPGKPDPLHVVSRDERTRVEIDVARIRDGESWRAASGRVELLVQGRRADIGAGERLLIFAHLVAPTPAMNPGQFDYALYLRADRYRAIVRADHPEGITIVGRPSRLSLTHLVDAARSYGMQMLDRTIEPQRRALSSAVLLGAREQLDPELTEGFMETGTIHLLM